MHLEVTFKNVRARDEVRKRAQVLYAKLERFLDPAAEGLLIIAAEHGVFRTEVTVTAHTGVHQAHDEHEDLRTALDRTFHTVETALRRAKERREDQRHSRVEKADGFVVEPPDDFEEAV